MWSASSFRKGVKKHLQFYLNRRWNYSLQETEEKLLQSSYDNRKIRQMTRLKRHNEQAPISSTEGKKLLLFFVVSFFKWH